MLIEFLSVDFSFEDERGSLVQLTRTGCQQVNIVFSKAGALRGRHYHKLNRESFFVIYGEFELIVSKGEQTEKFLMKKGDFFTVPPMVVHSFVYIKDSLLAAMYDKGIELTEDSKDIISL